MKKLRGVFRHLAKAKHTTRRISEVNSGRVIEAYQQVEEDTPESIDSSRSNERLSLDAHSHHLERRLSMEALVVLHSDRNINNQIISNEEVGQGNMAIQPTLSSAANYGLTFQDPGSVLPLYFPDASLPAEAELLVREDYFNDHITSLEQQGLLGPAPTSMPMSKELAIREALKPVTSGLDELEHCFCGAPYDDITSKIGKDSHEAVKVPGCTHVFGKHCIVKWLHEKDPPTCPMCRKRVYFMRNVPVERREAQELYRVVDYHYEMHPYQH